MNGYIKESNRGGVYNRLYLDSTVRKKKQEINELKVSPLTDPITKTRQKIENVLFQKHAKSQAKLNTIRSRQLLKESEGLQPGPSINKVSRQIAEMREGNSSEPLSLYAAKLMNTSRSASALKIVPKQSFLSLLDLQSAESSGRRPNAIRIQEESEEEPQIDQNVLRYREYAALRSVNNNRDKEIQELRQAVFDKCKVIEPEEPPQSILSMNVLERNAQWLRNKNLRLGQQKEILASQETAGCTFSPKLLPRVETQLDPRRSDSSLSNSYLAKFTQKSTPSLSTKKDAKEPEVQNPGKSLLYKAISPHERTLSLGQSMKLLSNARPMVSYNHK